MLLWHPTPVHLPGKSRGRRSLVGCSPWGHKELDMTERFQFHFSLSCIGEGNGNPLQCSCLENPRDRGAWWAAVYGVKQSWTWLKRLSSSSRYGFATLHVHGALFKERGLLTVNWKDIKNKEEILTLVDAVCKPEKVAVIHCQLHQKEDTPRAWENWLADKATKHAAEKFGTAGGGPIRTFVLFVLFDSSTVYPSLAEAERATKNEKGWWELTDGRLLVPESLAPTPVSQVHQATHLGHDKMEELIWKYFLIAQFSSLCRMES